MKYFQQVNGAFQRPVASPLRDISIYMGRFTLSPVPIFADWDGDGSTDLVLTGTDKVQYFQRGVCTPYCQQGTCIKQTSKCDCIPGTEGPDCSLCGEFHVRDDASGTCRKCPGYDSLAGTCSRRGGWCKPYVNKLQTLEVQKQQTMSRLKGLQTKYSI